MIRAVDAAAKSLTVRASLDAGRRGGCNCAAGAAKSLTVRASPGAAASGRGAPDTDAAAPAVDLP